MRIEEKEKEVPVEAYLGFKAPERIRVNSVPHKQEVLIILANGGKTAVIVF